MCMCSVVAGVGYPAYASCKALDSGSSSEKSHWLAYWLAFGGVSAVEACLAQRFPGYSHLKLLLLLWLQSRRYQGAWRLYIEVVRPLYRRLRPQADGSLHQAASVMVRLCVLTPTLASRSLPSHPFTLLFPYQHSQCCWCKEREEVSCMCRHTCMQGKGKILECVSCAGQ